MSCEVLVFWKCEETHLERLLIIVRKKILTWAASPAQRNPIRSD